MKKLPIIITAVLLCLCCTCCTVGTPAAVEPVPANTPSGALVGGQSYKRVELERIEDIVLENCVAIFPAAVEEEHREINAVIRREVIAKMQELKSPVYSSFHVKLNSCGVLSLMMEFFSIETDELLGRLPLNFSTVTNELITLADCFGKGEESWRVYLPDIIEYQAEDRDLVLLSPILPIADEQLFYITGRSLVLVYRPYEITTATELWPEFYMSLPSLSYICGDGSILGTVSELYESSVSSQGTPEGYVITGDEFEDYVYKIYEAEFGGEIAEYDENKNYTDGN